MSFIETILLRTKTNISILVFCILFGFLAYLNIPKESTPDVRIPLVIVNASYNGISPQDAERLLVKPIEQQVKNIEGVKKVKSTAYEGGCHVIIEFKAGLSSEKSIADVREKVDRAKSDLPDGADAPTITEINLSLFPILSIKLGGDLPLTTIYKIAERLKEDIESSISSVLSANISGNQIESVEVIVNPAELTRLNLSFTDLMQRVVNCNQMISAAYTDAKEGRMNLKISGIISNVFDIMNIPIHADSSSVLKLKDIALIKKAYKDPVTIVYDRIENHQSKQAVVLEISKRTGENLIDTVSRVKALIESKKSTFPPTLSITYSNDESDQIRDMLKELQNNIILAIILVMAVIIASLGMRSAILVGVAVPGSFLMGIMALSFLDATLNIVVLFSLIFSIGMLVDGAIIVVEYADRLMEEDNMDHKTAYKEAALRMLWPVITSISTILVVFLPLLFWPGVVGQFMKYMPITLLCVLTASILMALIFIPSIGISLKKITKKHHTIHDSAIEKLYLKVLNIVLEKPKKTIITAILILFFVKIFHGFVSKGVEFFPSLEPDRVAFSIHSRGDLSLLEKKDLVKEAESRILDMNELKSVTTYVGRSNNENSKDVIGYISVEFIDWKLRKKASLIISDILKRMENIPGTYVSSQKDQSGPSSGKPIQLEISSIKSGNLENIVKKIETFMKSQEGLIGVETSLPLPSIEWQFMIDKTKVARFGVNIADLGSAIRLLTIGTTIGTYRPDDAKDVIDILLRFDKKYRSLDALNKVTLKTPKGTMPISNFVDFKPMSRVNQIDRVDGKRVISLFADIAPHHFAEQEQQKISEWIKNQDFIDDISFEYRGEDEDRQETGGFLMKAFGAAIFLVWLILVTQFNSFFKAFLVLSAVVMSTVGVFVGLIIHNMPFGIVMGGIGIIALSGIIVSNNIILIDTFDHLMEDLRKKVSSPTLNDLKNVIIKTCLQRLRPVILTKLTAVLGLLPILFRMEIDFLTLNVHFGGPSTEWWILLAICIVYGIIFASSLTLLVTPCALWLKTKKDYEKEHISTAESAVMGIKSH